MTEENSSTLKPAESVYQLEVGRFYTLKVTIKGEEQVFTVLERSAANQERIYSRLHFPFTGALTPPIVMTLLNKENLSLPLKRGVLEGFLLAIFTPSGKRRQNTGGN